MLGPFILSAQEARGLKEIWLNSCGVRLRSMLPVRPYAAPGTGPVWILPGFNHQWLIFIAN
jgi:hypothetical protein